MWPLRCGRERNVPLRIFALKVKLQAGRGLAGRQDGWEGWDDLDVKWSRTEKGC